MPVKIFVPKIPSNEEAFIGFIKKVNSNANIRVSKNKDGSSYCVILLNYNDVKCANDVIKEISGFVIDDIVLKPRIYVDQTLLCKLSNTIYNVKETPDDVVNTTHFSDGNYYVQLLSEKDSNVILSSMLRDLYENYNSGKVSYLNYEDIVIGELYATFYNNEHRFYRIKILEKHNPEEIKISFIDYGNEELINHNNIVPITDKLAHFAPMVHKCVITGVKIINPKREEIVSREILNRNYKAKLVKKKDDLLKVDRVVSLDYLDFTSISYRNYLIIEDIADKCMPNGIESQSRNGFKDEASLVILTHFESLDEFYVQPMDKLIDDAMKVLNNSIPKLVADINDQLEYIGPEHTYLSQFSQDGNWYRCRVTNDQFESQNPHCIVQYVDYGNSEIKYHKGDLKPLVDKYWPGSEETRVIPPCAKKCKFSDDLIYALSKAKMGKDYFQQNFVIPEKIVTFTYYFDSSNKVWIVDNIKLNDNEDIISIVLQQCENTEKTDIYRLSNLEYLDKIWFVLVKSIDATVQDQLITIDKWSKEQNTGDLERVKQVVPGTIYCAKLHSGNLVRCCVIGRTQHNVMIQAVDTGVYDIVSTDSIFHLHEYLQSIKPIAKSFKLVFDVICVEEHQITEKIVQILGNQNVELDMIDDSCIRDVIIKEKSLVQLIAQLDYIQPNIGLKDKRFDETDKEFVDLPDCLLPGAGDDSEINCVDFSLPSVEKMDEVPKEILILNSKVRFMRKLFNIRTPGIFDELFRVVSSCDKMTGYVECCTQVSDLNQSVETLNGEFINLSCNIKTKLRDFGPLIEKRTVLCQTICALYAHLGELLLVVSFENLECLLTDIGKMITSVNNLMEIFQISADLCSSSEVDIIAVQNKITEFRNCEFCNDLVNQLERHSHITDELIIKYQEIMDAMYKEYQFDEVLPNPQTAAVPLIDCTYELHGALKSESANFIKLLAQEDVLEKFDIINIVQNYYAYLRKQKMALEMIVAQAAQLESLNTYATSILADDSATSQMIEDNHRQIISYRSALKHSIADMEDAEEQDDRQKIDEMTDKIEEVRKSLHEALKSSRDMIDPEVRKLMIRKPELQLKNQSIFYCNEGIPVFLWDSIFFEIPHTDVFTDFFKTRFSSDVVNMKRLSLSVDNYKTVLHNLTTYSSRINGSIESIVSPLPISYMFLSKSENTMVYMILPNFAGIHQLPEHFIKKLVHIIDFFKSTINQILNLWHLGFTYSERDLENGLFVTSLLDQTHVFLPLPLNSILNRENINHMCETIQVYFSKLGDLLQESLNLCSESASINDADIQVLLTTIKNCKGVEEAEQIFEDLDQFLIKFGPRENDNDLSNDNGSSSIEQLQYEEDASLDEHNDSLVKEEEISVTERILDIDSDIE